MYKSLQLNAVTQICMHGSHSVQAHLPGKNHPGTSKITIVGDCIAVYRAGLGAYMYRQPRQFFPQAGNRT